MELTGKHVVVTGGSQGIGEALADSFAAAGATVLVVARSTDRLETIAGRIGGKFVTADLGDADTVDGLFERCVEVLGHVDVFVNNAGIETSEAFVDVPPDELRAVARLNYEAPLVLTRAAVAHMLERGSGHVVQMSSVAGAIPFPGLAAYAGTKAGLTNFTETLRLELKGRNVGLTVVAPGPVDTEMWDRLETDDGYARPALRRFAQLQFLPKLDPVTIAEATVRAVERDRAHVRMPARFGMYHVLNNAPRRLVQGALVGVKLHR